MHYPNLTALIADSKRALAAGPIALILVEDDCAVAATIRHHADLGFATVIVFCSPRMVLSDLERLTVQRVDCDVTGPEMLPQIVNAVSAAAVGKWIYYCYNAEFLFFPFSESRSIAEMLAFVSEERRQSVMTYLVDLYPDDLTAAPNGVDLENAWFDSAGYFANARFDPVSGALDRQVDVYGGLRWRFEQFIPYPRRRLDRVAFFVASNAVQIGADGLFSAAEYNTYACPWHHNLTANICSFRAAKALRRNPDSCDAIERFTWEKSQRFHWQAQQLLDLGLMEPGQWF
jgi:hypothetical protein